MTTVTFTSTGSWTSPAGLTVTDCQCWGEGGTGATAVQNNHSGGGGGGGEFAEETTLVVHGSAVYNFTIGAGGSSTATTFPGDSVTVTAHPGNNASGTSGATGGSGSTNSIHHNGGNGGSGVTAPNVGAGGGGSSAGTGAAGANGANQSGTSGGAGGTAPAGGGNGGAGGNNSSNGNAGSVPGGGGGGGGDVGSNHAGGSGATGQITLTYTVTTPGTATLSGVGTLTASSLVFNPNAPAASLPSAPGKAWMKRFGWGRIHQVLPGLQVQTLTAGATLTGVGTLSSSGGPPAPVMVNQWQNNYGQNPMFGSIIPPGQSCIVPLNTAYKVGPGSGTPTAGNWLFTIVSWTQFSPGGNVYVGVGDDIHSYWREYPAAGSGGAVRTAIAYTANTARTVGDIYVALSGEVAAINVIVIEISGLGPWDTVSGTNINYAAVSTSLNLALGAPGQSSFTIAAFGGDNVQAGMTFAPAGWTTLTTETQTNGVDHTCDNILAGAFLPATSGSISVNGTSLSQNLSGFMLQVFIQTASPIPAGQNPNWPYVKFEAAFGAGFNTPNSELTWTDLTGRLWDWDETTGIQFQLGQIQATNLQVELDNFDGALSPSNTSSVYYPNVIPGTPVRIRFAMDSIGGVSVKRWYMIQRNAMQWVEAIQPSYRRQIVLDATDIWSILSSVPPTSYRAEIYNDKPYSWYPMDDQPGENGVLPTTLLNAASGNLTLMNIVASPNGVTAQDAYGANGADLTSKINSYSSVAPPPSVAAYAVGTNAGWMYGDPPSSASSFSSATGNPVEPSTGSASWQQGGLLGTSGSQGWFLSANDTGFPPLAGGITVKGWFNCGFYGSAVGFGYVDTIETDTDVLGQPRTAITICTLTTNNAPVAQLQLDTSGHLNFITFSGGAGVSNTIYSASDLRSQAWIAVDMTLTTTTWNVLVNGGLTANVSGSATGMPSAWTYLILNGDMGLNSGANQSAIQHSGNISLSHWAVFPYILPTWKLLNHYTAAITGFGLLPAPIVQIQPVISETGTLGSNSSTLFSATPDGYIGQGHYGGNNGQIGSGGHVSSYSFSMLMTANAGSYSSAPSARVVLGAQGGVGAVTGGSINSFAATVWASLANPNAPAYNIYTSASAGNETEASVILGQGDAYTKGYGATATDVGVSVIRAGNGFSPPTAATPLGDSVGQRIERLLLAGRTTSPNRCIDAAPDLVEAPGISGGGTQTGASIQAIQQSDSGLLFVDNCNKLNYWGRSHLAIQYSSPVWTISPNAPPTAGASLSNIPYHREIQWIADPQRVWNVIEITPFSPSGAQIPALVPTSASSVQASQVQYGAQPLVITSWLQNKVTMQAQANWLFVEYGVPRRRIEELKINAATHPAAFPLVVGINVGDIVTVQDWQLGNTGTIYTYRVSTIHRRFIYGEDQESTEASVTLTLDFEPQSYYGVGGYTDAYLGTYS